jgi:glycosyltransferase involved in cell wall biosynthesis
MTWNARIQFYGTVGGQQKLDLLAKSKGLVFPVKWHEPFGLALIESLYFGCPVFGTPYGSLPEIIPADFGYLSAHADDLAHAMKHAGDYNKEKCHRYAREVFDANTMAKAYLAKYEMVLNGNKLSEKPVSLLEKNPAKFLNWD